MVEDTGPGIPAQERGHVFETGFRGEAAREKSGSGYGLAIAKELVEAHGGSIEVAESSPRGTRFIITLPAEPQPA
jgi:signal transduction histidine kinase